MPVFDGQPVSAAITNPAFLYKNTDDTTTGIVGLLSAAPASGASIANIQGAVNHTLNTTGATVTTDGTTYSSTTVITNGTNHKIALGALDARFNGTTGHNHDGTAGNGPIITTAADPNAIYRNGSQPPTANIPWGGFAVTNLNYIESSNALPATTGFVRMAMNDGMYWRNAANTANIPFTNDGLGFRFGSSTLYNAGTFEGFTNQVYVNSSAIPKTGVTNVLQVNSNTADTGVAMIGIYAIARRAVTGNVSDTARLACIEVTPEIDVPGGFTYTNTQQVAGVYFDSVTTGLGTHAIANYAAAYFAPDNRVTGGRKSQIGFNSTFTGGTHNARITDNATAFTGTWFINQTDTTIDSCHVGAFRFGNTGTVFGGSIEKVSLTHTLTATPASTTYSQCLAQVQSFATPITVNTYGLFAVLLRNTPLSVTDTAFNGVISSGVRYDLNAGQTYTSTSSVNAFRVETITNTNGCTIAIASYRGIRINDDATVITGRKLGIRFGTWSGATLGNALISDNESTGTWNIHLTTSKASLLNGSFVNATAALLTTATDGFYYLPTCNGTPTGVPTTFTGTDAAIVDSSTGSLYIYNAGAWMTATATYNYQLTAAQIPSTVTAAATYNVAANDVLIRVDSTANAITVKLPNPNTRRLLRICDVGGNLNTNNLNVQQFAAETISGLAATLVLSSNRGTWGFQSDGTNWILV